MVSGLVWWTCGPSSSKAYHPARPLRGRRPQRTATLTPPKRAWRKSTAKIADEVASLGRELDELNRIKDPPPAQMTRARRNRSALEDRGLAFSSYLKRLAQELGETRNAGERMEKIRASEGLQDTLRELGPGTVALHTVVGEDRYRVILTTAMVTRAIDDTRPAPADQ